MEFRRCKKDDLADLHCFFEPEIFPLSPGNGNNFHSEDITAMVTTNWFAGVMFVAVDLWKL